MKCQQCGTEVSTKNEKQQSQQETSSIKAVLIKIQAQTGLDWVLSTRNLKSCPHDYITNRYVIEIEYIAAVEGVRSTAINIIRQVQLQ